MKRKIFIVILIIVSVILTPIVAIVSLYIMWSLLYTEGSIQPFIDQDRQALNYLKERYGKDFTVIRDGGGSGLGGPVTYFKRLAPVSDTSMEFVVSRCLARCSPKQSKEFSDTYPYAVWTKQETEELRKHPESMNIPSNAKVSAHLYGQGYNKNDTWMLAKTDTGVVPFRDLPKDRRSAGYTLYVALQDRNPNPTQEDFLSFAKTLVAIRTKMNEEELSFDQFIANIAPREPSDDSGWNFYSYSYTSPGPKSDTQSAEEIAEQFKKNTFTDFELSKKIKNSQH